MFVICGGRQQGRTYLRFKWIVERKLAGQIPMSKEEEEIFKQYDNNIDVITKVFYGER